MPSGIKIIHSNYSQQHYLEKITQFCNISPAQMNDASFTSLSDLKFITCLLNKSMKLINILLQQALQHCSNNESLCLF